MARKTNPTIYRLGIIKDWKSKYIAKKTTESSILVFQDLEIKKFIYHLFLKHQLKINDYKTYFSEKSLHLYISYCSFTKPIKKVKFKHIILKNLKKKTNFKHKNNINRKKLQIKLHVTKKQECQDLKKKLSKKYIILNTNFKLKNLKKKTKFKLKNLKKESKFKLKNLKKETELKPLYLKKKKIKIQKKHRLKFKLKILKKQILKFKILHKKIKFERFKLAIQNKKDSLKPLKTTQKKKLLLPKKFEQEMLLFKFKTIKNKLYAIKTYNKKILKKRKLFQKQYLLKKKNQRLSHIQNIEICSNKTDRNTFNQKSTNLFISKVLKSLSLFTEKQYNIFLNLNLINKTTTTANVVFSKKKNIKHRLRKCLMRFRRYEKEKFFRTGISILYNFVRNSKDPTFLADFIAFYIQKYRKKRFFFLYFVIHLLNSFIFHRLSKLKSIQLELKGRLTRALRARRKCITIGETVPNLQINTKVNYGESTSYSSKGTFGIKIWTFQKT